MSDRRAASNRGDGAWNEPLAEGQLRSVFLSYSFEDQRTPLLEAARKIIEAIVGRPPADGKILNGTGVLPAVLDKVAEADAVVCLLTQNAQRTGWVYAEYFASKALEKPVILLIEEPIKAPANALRDVVKIMYRKREPLPAVAELAACLGALKEEAGREVKAILLPEDLRERASLPGALCEYASHRPYVLKDPKWSRAQLVSGPSRSVCAILPSVGEGHVVRVRVTVNNSVYTSLPVEQNLVLNLS
jgi:hypothetical protein